MPTIRDWLIENPMAIPLLIRAWWMNELPNAPSQVIEVAKELSHSTLGIRIIMDKMSEFLPGAGCATVVGVAAFGLWLSQQQHSGSANVEHIEGRPNAAPPNHTNSQMFPSQDPSSSLTGGLVNNSPISMHGPTSANVENAPSPILVQVTGRRGKVRTEGQPRIHMTRGMRELKGPL
ncbi:uncharacterized protein KY384_002850 [Bacidia gigantensis]|uniref:uncharacterized protein n=1 Tax=Bacidia gigantensis TaxID=2732470 RepID=UPI001D04CADC|nr:uncharacterized protein KY384_002850 [Bacidia gigantensis]KAG8532365.1 hypothetical protein KY384_002850 [Bacidia gigantensis]